MPRSTTKNSRLYKAAAVLFWLGVWQLATLYVGQEILLVSPFRVVEKLLELAVTPVFWRSVGFSFVRIISGFSLGLFGGILLAVAAARLRPARELLAIPMSAIKSVPVASFVILLLIWMPSRNLAVPLTFLMVLPIVYENTLGGIRSTDPSLLEMARVFRVGAFKRARFIYLSQVMPFFVSACRSALGLCWKAGIAAEVIALPRGSIGERLYEAKIYLQTGELLAWTAVIVLLSAAFEKLFMTAVRLVCVRLVGVKP